jgi:LacI family transcriptional regulator
MAKKNSVRIDDVARLARVSTATVSRTLGNPDLVKPDTAKAVLDAVSKLGYVAHGHGRALASRKSRVIGAILPSLQNSIFAVTISAIQETLRDHGYMLIVACSEYDQAGEINLVTQMIERGVDGLILTQTLHRPEVFSLLERNGLPHVFTWAYDSTGNLPAIGFDHRRASSLVTRHLLALGHREFGVIATTTSGNRNSRDRLDGVIETLEDAGITLSASQVREATFSYADGRRAFRLIFETNPPPTALICLNDMLAIGAMAEAVNMGLVVPRDLSVVGCEDLEVAASVNPPLTTVRYPSWEMGHVAANAICSLIADKPLPDRTKFDTELIVRASTAPPKSSPPDAVAHPARLLSNA